MLTEEEKQKIKAEEIFRHEVRNSLAAKKQQPGLIMGFLNSALGIWFLSTIVIGLFTYTFNEYKENRKASEERAAKIRQLDMEIESRISQFWVHTEPLIKRDTLNNYIDTGYALKEGVTYDTLAVLWKAFKNPPAFYPALTTTIYKEYETRTTLSLMIELATLLEEKYGLEKGGHLGIDPELRFTKEEIKQRQEVDAIKGAATFIGGNGIYDTPHPSVKAIWNAFNEKIIVRRWDKLFPYTDCLFC